MLGHLNEQDLAFYNNILKARAEDTGILTEEQKLARKLLSFDWTYRESDSASVSRHGHQAEEELIAEIDSSSIDEELKMKWLKLFSSSYETQTKELQQYRWLTCRNITDDDLARSKVGLALKGVTDEQYSRFLGLQAKFQRFSDILTKAQCGERLIMTDDCLNFTLVRERAMEQLKKEKDLFFFGVALPAEAQDLIDDIVRNDKDLFVEMVETGVAKVMFVSFQIDSNNPDAVWLVTAQMTGSYKDAFGFYFNPKPTRPRRDWKPKLEAPKAPLSRAKPSMDKFNEFAGQFNENINQAWMEGTVKDRRDAKNANIPAIPERRTKTPMALSNRPMSVPDKPKAKKTKSAPQPRKQKFTVLREVKS